MMDNLHLWEVKHPYYCSESNYFRGGCVGYYDSWGEFLEAEGESDPDLNLLFRWDWSDDNILELFWVGQRKGLFRSTAIRVKREDEPAIRDWLMPRLHHLRQLWTPLEVDAPEAVRREADEPRSIAYEPGKPCESCESEDVPVYDFSGRTLCRFCSSTLVANVTKYESQYRSEVKHILVALAQAANNATKGDEAAVDRIAEAVPEVFAVAKREQRQWDTYNLAYRENARLAVLRAMSGRRGHGDAASLEDVLQAVNGTQGIAMTRDTEQAIMDLIFEGKIKMVLTDEAHRSAWKLRSGGY